MNLLHTVLENKNYKDQKTDQWLAEVWAGGNATEKNSMNVLG